MVSTMGHVIQLYEKQSFDISELRMIIVDEADEYFKDLMKKRDFNFFDMTMSSLGLKVQKIFFSTTLNEYMA